MEESENYIRGLKWFSQDTPMSRRNSIRLRTSLLMHRSTRDDISPAKKTGKGEQRAQNHAPKQQANHTRSHVESSV